MAYRVRVYAADSAPIAGATVTFGDESAETDDAGVASFPDIGPAVWAALDVVADGYARVSGVFPTDDGARVHMAREPA